MKFKKIILTIFASSLGLCVPAAISIAKTEAVSSEKNSSTSKDDIKKFDDFLKKNGIFLDDLSSIKYSKKEADISVNFDRRGEDLEEVSNTTRTCATQILLSYAVFNNLFKQFSKNGEISSVQSNYVGYCSLHIPFKGSEDNVRRLNEDSDKKKNMVKKFKEKKIDFDNLRKNFIKNCDSIMSKLSKYKELLSRIIENGGKDFDKKQKELACYLLKQQIYFDRGAIDPEKFLLKDGKYDDFLKDQGKEMIKFLKKSVEKAITHSKDLIKEIKKINKKDFEKLKKDVSDVYINVFNRSNLEGILDETLGKTLNKKDRNEDSYHYGYMSSPLFCRNIANENDFNICKNIFYSMAIDFFNKKIANSPDKDKINKIAKDMYKEEKTKSKRYNNFYSGPRKNNLLEFLRIPLLKNFLKNGYKLPLISIDGMPYVEVSKTYSAAFAKLIGNEDNIKKFIETINKEKFEKYLKECIELMNKRNEERLKNFKDSMDENKIKEYYKSRKKELIEDLKKENEEIDKTLNEDKNLNERIKKELNRKIEKNKDQIKKYEKEITDEKEIEKAVKDNKIESEKREESRKKEYKRAINAVKKVKYSHFKKNILDLFK